MLEKVPLLLQEVEGFVPKSEKELEEFRLSFLGKKGILNELFAAFKGVPNEHKKEFGEAINRLKHYRFSSPHQFNTVKIGNGSHGSFHATKK